MTILITIILFILIGFGVLLQKRMKNKAIIEICNLSMANRFKESLKKIDKFLKFYPSCEEVWLIKGNIGNDINDTKMAKDSFIRALKLKPNYPKALAGMGRAMRKEKKYNDAEDYYYKALKLDPELYLAKSSLMLLELYKGNFDVAVSLGEDSVKNGIDQVQNRIIENLMIAYHYAGKTEERDKLFNYLKINEYSRLFALELIFSNQVTIEELMET